MNFRWSREESGNDCRVDFHCGLRNDIADRFDFFIKVAQLLEDHCAEDSLDFTILWEGHIDEIETTLQTFRNNHSPSSRWTHRR